MEGGRARSRRSAEEQEDVGVLDLTRSLSPERPLAAIRHVANRGPSPVPPPLEPLLRTRAKRFMEHSRDVRQHLSPAPPPGSAQSDLLHSRDDSMRRPDLRKLRYSSEYVERPKDEPIGVTSIAFGIATSVNSFSAEWELLARGTDGLAFEDDRGRGRNCALVLSIQGQTANRQQRIVIEVRLPSGSTPFYFLFARLPD